MSNVLNDTRNINVIRGSSLSLRTAIKLLCKKFPDLKPISTGASVGLFSFEKVDNDSASELKESIEKWLQAEKWYTWLSNFTFVLDIQKEERGFQKDKEAVIALNRFRQMQQLSVAMPKKSQVSTICALDNLRPANEIGTVKGKKEKISFSIQQRLKHGRNQKRRFYREETQIPISGFVGNIEELGKFSKEELRLLKEKNKQHLKQLNNKIAVLYFDGNGFSGIQKEKCETVENQREFDKTVQQQRRDFLADLLTKIENNEDFKTAKGEVRIETLLWGGDEMTFVVPAWKGLEVLNFFYQQSHDWQFSGAKLTHAGGIVFCQANSPIQRIEKLARDLADGVKDTDEGRKCNFFDFMVLESIDFPTESLALTRERQFGKELMKSHTPLVPLLPWTEDKRKAANKLKNLISKGQAYKLARAAVQDSQRGENKFKDQQERLYQVTQTPDDFWCGMLELGGVEIEDEKRIIKLIEHCLETLFPNDKNNQWRWLHLVELWDYLV